MHLYVCMSVNTYVTGSVCDYTSPGRLLGTLGVFMGRHPAWCGWPPHLVTAKTPRCVLVTCMAVPWAASPSCLVLEAEGWTGSTDVEELRDLLWRGDISHVTKGALSGGSMQTSGFSGGACSD